MDEIGAIKVHQLKQIGVQMYTVRYSIDFYFLPLFINVILCLNQSRFEWESILVLHLICLVYILFQPFH